MYLVRREWTCEQTRPTSLRRSCTSDITKKATIHMPQTAVVWDELACARRHSQAKNFTSGAGSHNTRIDLPDGAHPCVAFLVDLIELGGLRHDFVPEPFERVQHPHSLALGKNSPQRRLAATRIRLPDRAHPCAEFLPDLIEFGSRPRFCSRAV